MATEHSHTTEAGTQTDVNTAVTTPSPGQSEAGYQPSIAETLEEEEEKEEEVKEPIEVDYTQIDISVIRKLTAFPDLEDDLPAKTSSTKIPNAHEVLERDVQAGPKEELKEDSKESASPRTVSESEPELDADDVDELDQNESELDDDGDDDDDFEDAEEPVIYEVATAQPPRMFASQAIQVKGAVVNIPRRVPPPLPLRNVARLSRNKAELGEVNMVSSPLRNEFEPADDASTPKPGESFTPATSEELSVPTASLERVKKESRDLVRPVSTDREPVDYFTRSGVKEKRPMSLPQKKTSQEPQDKDEESDVVSRNRAVSVGVA